MSLESILEKIGREAQAERERIIRESREKAEKLRSEVELEAQKQSAQLLKESAREAELEAHRLVTQARLKKRLRLLALKKELVDEVLNQAFERQAEGSVSLKRQVVLKEGIREEILDRKTLKQELRPQLEGYIAELLKK
ncbi:MAG: V-type ATP synthase subunit E family protein [Candidatus Aminicenantaceae bacterium]